MTDTPTSDKPKRRREVERIEDWDDARYSHVPPRAALDERLTLAHLRVLVLIGKVNTQHGWCQLSQKDTAELFGLNRQTVNAAIADLVGWRYVEMRTQAQTKTSFCHYRVLIDEPEGGVSSTGDTPPGGGVSSPDDTGVGARGDTGVVPEATPPMYKEHAREITDQRSLPPKSPSGGPSAKPVHGQWKADALAALRERGRHRDAIEALIAPLMASDKRLSLGKGAALVDALADLALAAHGVPRPALDAALARLLAQPKKLTPSVIRAEIDVARRCGAMIVIRRGSPQWARWHEHYRASGQAFSARFMDNNDAMQVPSEWPPARGGSSEGSAAA
ncbi:MAG: MarR family transcriptional regulator [Hyphomicrobium sp.]|uniref:MarR family transcriptional regulator n=1 Tax=Hyphomicrobium sp. TaxID=82 RepID=UPI003D10529B